MNKIILTLLFFISTAYGQSNLWKVITNETIGIQLSGIYAIVEDMDSNIWIGTWTEGLFKFDGDNWINYDTSNTPLLENRIRTLGVDSSNTLWIGTSGFEGGLARLDGDEWTVWELDNYGVEGTSVFDIEFDDENNLWMGTYWDGLLKFDGVDFTLYNSETTDLNEIFEEINVVAIDDSGYIWCGSDAWGSVRFDGISEWEYYDVGRTHMDFAIYSIDFDNYGNLIFGGANFVSIYDGISQWTHYRYGNSSWNWNMEIDKDSVVYFAATFDGFLKLDYSNGEEWTHLYPPGYNLEEIGSTGLMRDSKNNFWIGYNNGYLAIYNPDGLNGITDVEEEKNKIPKEFILHQNYPNPFNPTTKIRYSVPGSKIVQIKVFDVLGKKIKTLLNEYKQTGTYEIAFDASNLTSGVYFYQLSAGIFVETKKMILLR